MVKKRQTKRQRDIKTKLMAAICMLLVSSIMMVSTTYAWFTLSTAPEVTGINTAVGANGNLEMALQPLDGDSSTITSGTSDSMAVQSPVVSNLTWGNLVKLDNNYGLEDITLYPAELKTESIAEGEGTITLIKTNPLGTPVYGADGRISELAENTITGVYTDGAFYESAPYEDQVLDNPFGVRAIGTSSGMTPRNLAYRQALSTANTAAGQAKNAASTSLNNNGSTLADVAITHALNSGTEQDVYTLEQVNAMKAVVTDLLGDASTVGSLQYIEQALKNYIAANSIAVAAAEQNYEELQAAILAASLDDLAAGSVDGAILPDGFTGADGFIAKLNTAKANATTANNALSQLSGAGPFTWAQVSPALSELVNTSGLLLNGTPVADVMDDPGAAAGSIMANGLTLTMGSGSGVYSDIADFCGNYSAGIIIPELRYGTMVVPDVQATMNTNGASPTYLAQAADNVGDYQSATGNGGANPLTDFYGYIIDLAFRTNAADSWLKIQPTAVDRIYTDGSNTNTMGHGATMAFKSTSTTFTSAAVTRLMGAIRIVFFDTDSRQIIAYARLNAESAITDPDGTVTMPIFLCDADGEATGSDNIMQLDQNAIHELSVMVYLDGNFVGNDDVAADTASSMTGTLNLQFSSSATLVAMEYSDLKSGNGGALNGGNGEEEEEDEPVVTPVTAGTVSDGYNAVINHVSVGGNNVLVAVITGAEGAVTGGATVTIGGQTAVFQTVSGISGWVVASTADAPTEAVDVTVTVSG